MAFQCQEHLLFALRRGERVCNGKAFGEITLNEYRTEPGDANGSDPGPCSPEISSELGTSCHLGEAERAAIAQRPQTYCAGSGDSEPTEPG